MKWIILVGITVALGLVALEATNGGTMYNQETKTEQVEVDMLNKRITDAQDAAKADIAAKAQSAYDAAFEEAMTEIELEVTTNFRKEIETRELELAKEVESY